MRNARQGNGWDNWPKLDKAPISIGTCSGARKNNISLVQAECGLLSYGLLLWTTFDQSIWHSPSGYYPIIILKLGLYIVHLKIIWSWLTLPWTTRLVAKRIAGVKPPAKSGAVMIEMWNLAPTNTFCRLTLLKALVSSLSVHVHLISCFRALWEIILVFLLTKMSFIFYI